MHVQVSHRNKILLYALLFNFLKENTITMAYKFDLCYEYTLTTAFPTLHNKSDTMAFFQLFIKKMCRLQTLFHLVACAPLFLHMREHSNGTTRHYSQTVL